jgi:hypothetical protein
MGHRPGRDQITQFLWQPAHGLIVSSTAAVWSYETRLGLRPVSERQVLLVGARDLDPPEVSYLEGSAIRRAEVTDLDRAGRPEGPLYLHVDLDVIDSAAVPGLRYPAPGGPGPEQLADSMRWLVSTGMVGAVGLACTWFPGNGAGLRLAPTWRRPSPGASGQTRAAAGVMASCCRYAPEGASASSECWTSG